MFTGRLSNGFLQDFTGKVVKLSVTFPLTYYFGKQILNSW